MKTIVLAGLSIATIATTVNAINTDRTESWLLCLFVALLTLFVAAVLWNLPTSVEVDEEI